MIEGYGEYNTSIGDVHISVWNRKIFKNDDDLNITIHHIGGSGSINRNALIAILEYLIDLSHELQPEKTFVSLVTNFPIVSIRELRSDNAIEAINEALGLIRNPPTRTFKLRIETLYVRFGKTVKHDVEYYKQLLHNIAVIYLANSI